MNSSIGSRRVPRVEASSTSAPDAYSGGSASPAGEEEPRLPPIVPRLRICGEPTVREAIARPGSRSSSSSIARVYVTPAPTRTEPLSVSQRVRSSTRVRSRIVSGRARPKLMSTITSVPPHSGSASGWAALASSASSQLAGCRSSIRG